MGAEVTTIYDTTQNYLQTFQTLFWFPHLSCVLSVLHDSIPIAVFNKLKIVWPCMMAEVSC